MSDDVKKYIEARLKGVEVDQGVKTINTVLEEVGRNVAHEFLGGALEYKDGNPVPILDRLIFLIQETKNAYLQYVEDAKKFAQELEKEMQEENKEAAKVFDFSIKGPEGVQ